MAFTTGADEIEDTEAAVPEASECDPMRNCIVEETTGEIERNRRDATARHQVDLRLRRRVEHDDDVLGLRAGYIEASADHTHRSLGAGDQRRASLNLDIRRPSRKIDSNERSIGADGNERAAPRDVCWLVLRRWVVDRYAKRDFPVAILQASGRDGDRRTQEPIQL